MAVLLVEAFMEVYVAFLAKLSRNIGENNMARVVLGVLPILCSARVCFQGQELMILEAMKMEYTVPAPSAGTIDVTHFSEGDLVDEGAVLLTVRPPED